MNICAIFSRNSKVIWLLSLILISTSSCKVFKKAADSGSVTPKSVEYLIEQLDNNQLDFDIFNAKVSAKIKSKSFSQSFRVNIRMKRDSIIWLSASVIAGIELARMIITPDSIKLINRLMGSYFVGGPKDLKRIIAIDTDFASIQDLLAGNTITEIPVDFYKFGITGKDYLLTAKSRKIKKRLRADGSTSRIASEIRMDAESYRVKSLKIAPLPSQGEMKITYDDFKKIDKYLIPGKIQAKGNIDGPFETTLTYSKITINEEKPFPFAIPEKYNRVYY